MFGAINNEYTKKKNDSKANQFIIESVLDVEEVIPGSDEELEDVVDTDSIPDEVYAKVDKALDSIVDDPDYDDTEAEELVDDDDDDDDDELDDTINALIDEAVSLY